VILLVLLVGLAALAGCASRTSPDEAEVEVSDVQFSGEGANHYLSGTVTNPGPDRLNYVAVEGRFYDEDGAVLGTQADALLDGLDAGKSWKFSIWYYGRAASGEVSQVVTT